MNPYTYPKHECFPKQNRYSNLMTFPSLPLQASQNPHKHAQKQTCVSPREKKKDVSSPLVDPGGKNDEEIPS
jgi:hypothetical protein